MTPEKGINNLRVAISSDGSFGSFQAWDLVLNSEESTKSTATTGIKGLGIFSSNVVRLHVSSRSHSPPLSLFYSFVPHLPVFSSFASFLLCFVSQFFTNISNILHFLRP